MEIVNYLDDEKDLAQGVICHVNDKTFDLAQGVIRHVNNKILDLAETIFNLVKYP